MASPQILIERIYDAITDDDALHALPSQIATIAGGTSCFMAMNDSQAQDFNFVCSSGINPAFMDAYSREFAMHDPWGRALSQLPPNRFHDMEPLVPRGEVLRTRYYNDMQRPFGEDFLHVTVAALEVPRGVGFVSTQRRRAEGPFEIAAEQSLQPLVPHLRRLIIARHALRGAERQVGDLAAMVDRLETGVLQVDAEAKVLYANAAAADLLRAAQGQGDGIAYGSGQRLCAQLGGDRARLRDLIARACRGDGGAMLLQRASGAPALQLVITPLRLSERPQQPSAMVLVQAPANAPAELTTLLSQLYRLSAGEAQLAVGLANGHDLAELAQARSVSINTVRTVLKRALDKLGVHRQSALVGLIAHLPRLRPY